MRTNNTRRFHPSHITTIPLAFCPYQTDRRGSTQLAAIRRMLGWFIASADDAMHPSDLYSTTSLMEVRQPNNRFDELLPINYPTNIEPARKVSLLVIEPVRDKATEQFSRNIHTFIQGG